MIDTPLLTVKEVAELLRVDRYCIYRWVAESKIPFIRLTTRCLRFRKEDIDAWLNSFTQQTSVDR